MGGSNTSSSSSLSSTPTLLFNITCELLNPEKIYLNTSFEDKGDNIVININGVDAVCKGMYDYKLQIFGNKKEI